MKNALGSTQDILHLETTSFICISDHIQFGVWKATSTIVQPVFWFSLSLVSMGQIILVALLACRNS